jgi:uncharacterized damage-inducible protein DinB
MSLSSKISRKRALQTMAASVLPVGITAKTTSKDLSSFLEEFTPAWKNSEKYTLTIFEQMPESKLDWRYTPESFTFRAQFMHCIVFTSSQLSGRLGVKDPYETKSDWKSMTKSQMAQELRNFYAWVLKVLADAKPQQLTQMEGYVGEDIPIWRVFYALENHIIHHRGQAICYLRLNGITPEGYYGW